MERVLFKLFVVLVLCVSADSQELKDYELEGIKVLSSSRQEIERKIGPPLSASCTRCSYSTKTAKIWVEYAAGRCLGNIPGWNVPRDTILRYQVSLKSTEAISPNREPWDHFGLKRDIGDFILTSNDTADAIYTHVKRGIRVVVRVHSVEVEFFPPESAFRLRCKGYPPYDPFSEIYYPRRMFFPESLDDVKATIDGLSWEIIPETMGYLVIYFGRNTSASENERYLSRLRSYVKSKPELYENVKIVRGIRRNRAEIEVYHLNRNWPPPKPLFRAEILR